MYSVRTYIALIARYREMGDASRAVLDSARFSCLQGLFADRRNPVATRYAYAMFDLEDEALAKLIAKVQERCSDAHAVAYMFDGAIIQAPSDKTSLMAALEEFEDTSDGLGVCIKPFPDWRNSSA